MIEQLETLTPQAGRIEMQSDRIELVVYGTAQPGGSKRAVSWRAKDGRSGTNVIDANPKAAGWKKLVSQEAGKVMAQRGGALLEGALVAEFTFYLQRPKGHFNAKGQLKPSAPAFPTTRPDAGKLARSTADSLTGVVWRDDAQAVIEVHRKRYGTPERAELLIRRPTWQEIEATR